jgi:hypothetical protein
MRRAKRENRVFATTYDKKARPRQDKYILNKQRKNPDKQTKKPLNGDLQVPWLPPKSKRFFGKGIRRAKLSPFFKGLHLLKQYIGEGART